MKAIVFMFCVFIAIYAYAVPIKRPAAYYNSIESCLKNIMLNKTVIPITKLNFSQILPKNKYDDVVNANICALKKDGIITPEGTLSKSSLDQYCAKVLLNDEKILKCQKIVKDCTDLVCGGPGCTSEMIKPAVECGINSNILSLLDFSIQL
ncbi:uncharacterized protein LOC109859554 [Pseudomyrmex gracilis]|uniref:uncharacterized protein LOC109859554 n=1 Tax=Pseudomyrmex gracilis TaxID=219809 RepID=UPI00099597AF|nr:uncharacterized protein LOC109859554 [Pseudomyrmex gracilis]